MLSARRPAGLAAVAGVLVVLTLTLLSWPTHVAHAAPTSGSGDLADPVAPRDTSGYAVVAHRGYPGRGVTENTLPAFRRAVRYGATAVELDVQLTRDGRFLVMHDPSLDRTTTCRGRVDQRTLAGLQQRCRGRRGGERLPSLAQALDLVKRLHARVVVEVKRPPSAWTAYRYHRLVGTIRSAGMVDRTVLLGFHHANLEALRAIEPALPVQGIAEDAAEVAWMRTWADGVNLPVGLATPELVAGLHAEGLLVLGRKTSLRGEWARYDNAGVDGVLTGSVASYVSWERARAAAPAG